MPWFRQRPPRAASSFAWIRTPYGRHQNDRDQSPWSLRARWPLRPGRCWPLAVTRPTDSCHGAAFADEARARAYASDREGRVRAPTPAPRPPVGRRVAFGACPGRGDRDARQRHLVRGCASITKKVIVSPWRNGPVTAPWLPSRPWSGPVCPYDAGSASGPWPWVLISRGWSRL